MLCQYKNRLPVLLLKLQPSHHRLALQWEFPKQGLTLRIGQEDLFPTIQAAVGVLEDFSERLNNSQLGGLSCIKLSNILYHHYDYDNSELFDLFVHVMIIYNQNSNTYAKSKSFFFVHVCFQLSLLLISILSFDLVRLNRKSKC